MDDLATKTCRRCGATKPIQASFYRHSRMRDGHLNICTECVREQRREHRQKNIGRIREYDRRRGFRSDPEKHAARQAVRVALAQGSLVPGPCSTCGARDVEAHHEDYDRPLDVTWLCKRHHAELHRVYA